MGLKNSEPLNLHYDRSADVLYLSLGPPREAITIEVEEGILTRIDPETRQVIGFTIIDFALRFQRDEKLQIMLSPLSEDFLKG